MIRTFTAMLRNDEGASLVEYALIVALIAVVAIVVVRQLGGAVSSSLSNAATAI